MFNFKQIILFYSDGCVGENGMEASRTDLVEDGKVDNSDEEHGGEN